MGVSKKQLTIFGIPSLLLIVFLVYIFTPAGVVNAELLPAGTVQVDRGNGFESITEKIELDEGDIVKTSGDYANVVLYERTIVRVKPQSEIKISELMKDNQVIEQRSGQVWSKVLRLVGKEEYAIQTPTATATVRGTGFLTYAEPYTLLLAEGNVAVNLEGVQYDLTEGKKILPDGTITDLTEEDWEILRQEMNSDLRILQDYRWQRVMKHKTSLKLSLPTFGYTFDDVESGLEKLDKGELTIEEIEDKLPPLPPRARVSWEHIKLYTNAIRQHRAEIGLET